MKAALIMLGHAWLIALAIFATAWAIGLAERRRAIAETDDPMADRLNRGER